MTSSNARLLSLVGLLVFLGMILVTSGSLSAQAEEPVCSGAVCAPGAPGGCLENCDCTGSFSCCLEKCNRCCGGDSLSRSRDPLRDQLAVTLGLVCGAPQARAAASAGRDLDKLFGQSRVN